MNGHISLTTLSFYFKHFAMIFTYCKSSTTPDITEFGAVGDLPKIWQQIVEFTPKTNCTCAPAFAVFKSYTRINFHI
jgi:hypothetical protein